jgi:hypothetical protein
MKLTCFPAGQIKRFIDSMDYGIVSDKITIEGGKTVICVEKKDESGQAQKGNPLKAVNIKNTPIIPLFLKHAMLALIVSRLSCPFQITHRPWF